MQVRFEDTNEIREIPARKPDADSYFSIVAIFGTDMEIPEDVAGYTMELGFYGWVARPNKGE